VSSRGRKRSKSVRAQKPAKSKASDATPVDANGWPEGYVESFVGLPGDFERPPQGEVEEREPFN
jgi:hypothetical protein